MVAVITALVRAWTWCYTLGLSSDLRDARRGEIESDLWESRADFDSDGQLALQMVFRLLSGLLSDVLWRCDQHSSRSVKTVVVAIAIVGCCLAGLWLMATPQLPEMPAPSRVRSMEPAWPVPRPLPAPPPPPGTRPGDASLSTQRARRAQGAPSATPREH